MSATRQSVDATSKLWLTVLAVAVLASIATLIHSFIKATAPPEEIVSVTAREPTAAPTAAAPASAEPAWSFPDPARVAQGQSQPETPGVEPFSPSSNSAPKRQTEDAASKAMIHQQAETFRDMVKQNKVPGGLGDLTLEKVDEMEKNNVGVWWPARSGSFPIHPPALGTWALERELLRRQRSDY